MSFGRGGGRTAPTNDFGDNNSTQMNFQRVNDNYMNDSRVPQRMTNRGNFGGVKTFGSGANAVELGARNGPGFNNSRFANENNDGRDNGAARSGGFGAVSRGADTNSFGNDKNGLSTNDNWDAPPPSNNFQARNFSNSRNEDRDGNNRGAFSGGRGSFGSLRGNSRDNSGFGGNSNNNDRYGDDRDGADRNNLTGSFARGRGAASGAFSNRSQDAKNNATSRDNVDGADNSSGSTLGRGSNFGRGGGSGNFARGGGGNGFNRDGDSRFGAGASSGGGPGFGRGGGTAGGSTFGRFNNNFSRNEGDNRAFNRGGDNSNQGRDNFTRSDDGANGFGYENYVSVGPSHIPKSREISEIFEEDANSADNYLQIRTEDENVVVTGVDDTVVVVDNWAEAKLEESLMANINRAKYSVPRKIQSYAIPLIMDGYDVKGHAETGSGKTAAFLIPIINEIITKKSAGEYKSRRSYPYALIIEPTRELAIQLSEQARKLTHETGVSVAVAYGRYQIQDNLRAISCGCDILIGTTGRLKHFIMSEYVLMNDLKFFVLDEADRLLEDQFLRDLRKIFSTPSFPDKENRQTLLFSATFSEDVQKWADELLRKQNAMISNQKYASANNKVIQKFMMVSEPEKKEQLLKMLMEELEEKKKETPEGETPLLRRTLVFVERKRTADLLAAMLCQENIKATTINGDRDQQMREESLEKFRKNEVQVVVSTDVCARGIDIKDLDHVINMDLPEDYVTYVHRIGRTGRLKEGVATSFFDPLVNSELAVALVKGVRESEQVPPEFLVEASENRLVIPSEKEDDDAWGATTTSMAKMRVEPSSTFNSRANAGGAGFRASRSVAPTLGLNATLAPPTANEDW